MYALSIHAFFLWDVLLHLILLLYMCASKHKPIKCVCVRVCGGFGARWRWSGGVVGVVGVVTDRGLTSHFTSQID